MTWVVRRASPGSDELAASMEFAAEFAVGVDRSFPVDEAAIGRIRGRVLGAFVEASLSSSRRPVVRPIRRGLVLALVATTGLFIFGTVSVEAQPGGPFYPVKLAIETAGLPSLDVPAGWDARLDRLQRRIEESLAAARNRNPGAITVALVEYRSELTSLASGLVGPTRRSTLVPAVARDLAVVVGLEQEFPNEAARFLISDMQALIGAGGPEGGNPDPAGDTTGNPHAGGTTANPHAGGTTANPHAGGTTGNPHAGGTIANPHSGGSTTGNSHAGGTTGNPHSGGTTGNPHSGGTTGNPHAGG